MKWALLGADPEILALARQVVDTPGEQLVWAGQLGAAAPLVRSWAATLNEGISWEALLDRNLADAVLVGRDLPPEMLEEALRRLAQAGQSLVVSQPAGGSMLYYELEMIRQETGARLLPLLPARWHPAVTELYECLAGGPGEGVGPLEQVVFERRLADRSREGVLGQLARDLDLARALAGELTQVAALAPPSQPNRYATLGVQLSGPAGVLVRWSVLPGAGEQLTLNLLGRDGLVTLSEADDHWQTVASVSGAQSPAKTFPAYRPLADVIARLEQLAAAQSVQPSWMDAARAVELAEVVPRSLERGKTVELRADEANEMQAFKGTMAAAGCGLLLVSLLVFFVGTVAAGWQVPLAGYWPVLLLVALCLFLGVQLLGWLVPAEGR